MIINRAGGYPGVCRLNRPSESFRGKGQLGPFDAEFVANGQHRVFCHVSGEVSLAALSPAPLQVQRSHRANVMKDIPRRWSVRGSRKSGARESPLNNIDTTSVSTMAAFIASSAELPRTPPPTRRLHSVPRTTHSNREPARRPAERRVLRTTARGQHSVFSAHPGIGYPAF